MPSHRNLSGTGRTSLFNTGRIPLLITVDVVPQIVGENAIVLRFSVSDTGIGFPDGSLSNLFSPFTQADGSITRQFGGTGLGLSICKGLIDLMGGEIGAESAQFGGSNFWFTVPLELSAGISTRDVAYAELAGGRLILAGIPPRAAKIIQTYACAWGVTSDYFPDLACVTKILTSDEISNYDAIMIDATAVELDTNGLVAGLPDEIVSSSAAMILLSGSAEEGDVELASRAGFLSFLLKPVQQDQLWGALRSAILGQTYSQLNTTVTQPIPPVVAQTKLILVAEDSPTNRKVAMLQLNSLGFMAQAVANGREAVEAAETGAYALVLMDCQMPEMDGFQAAAAIRRSEVGSVRHLPIIAMTAHALSGDRERCLAVGMDDYISKPVDVDNLRAVVMRWINAASGHGAGKLHDRESGPEIARVDSASEVQTIIDEPLNVAVLESTCGKVVAREIVDVFLSAAETLLEGIDTARFKRDGLAVESLAHQLSGSSRAVGAIQMARLADAMEQAGGTQNWAAARAAYESLRWALKRLRRFLSSSMPSAALQQQCQ